MDIAKFEGMCRQRGMKILPKKSTEHGNILLAERQMRLEDGTPYYETYWFIERNGGDVGRMVRNNAYATVNGIHRSITKQERIQDALRDAEQFIEDNVKVERY